MSRLRVGVVLGGAGAEHDVSCASGLAVVRALAADRYDTVVLGLDRSGDLHLVPDSVVDRLRTPLPGRRALDDRLEVTGPRVRLDRRVDAPGALVVPATGTEPVAALDVAFPVLHGPCGEDGTVQGWFEVLGLPYVGCGVLASATGMDKVAAKRAWRAEQVPVTPYVVLDRAGAQADPLAATAHLRLPLYVKPARMGSSIGVTRVDVRDGATLAAALAVALAHDDVVLVEQGVTGRELEVGVLAAQDGDGVDVSVVGEVGVSGGWFDWDQKYLGDADPMTVPADLDPRVAHEARRLAERAFAAIGGEGLARVDLFLDRAGRLVVNEVNTMPGFTAHSMFPKVWAAQGVGYAAVLDRLVAHALRRGARTRRAGVAA